MVLATTQGTELGSRGSGDGKFEGSCVAEILLVNYCCVFMVGVGMYIHWYRDLVHMVERI